MTSAVALPERNEKALDVVGQAKGLVIDSNEKYLEAKNLRDTVLKDLEREVDEGYDEHISAAFKNHRDLVAKKKKYAEPIEEARKTLKGKMIAWEDEQEAKRKEAEENARTAAKKQAEAEQLKAAEEAEKRGETDTANEIINTPVETPAVVIPKEAPKLSGARVAYKFRVIDPAQVPGEYKVVDEKKIGAVVRATQGAVKIPGIQIYAERV